MKTFYVTGSTAGLNHKEMAAKFEPIVIQLANFGAETIYCVDLIETNKTFNWKEKMDERMRTVSLVDCVIFVDGINKFDNIENKFEFVEARRLGKEIRTWSYIDITDIESTLQGLVTPAHG